MCASKVGDFLLKMISKRLGKIHMYNSPLIVKVKNIFFSSQIELNGTKPLVVPSKAATRFDYRLNVPGVVLQTLL